MKTYSFKVVVESDEDAEGNAAWHACCPALESVDGATSGRTREEALSNINDVIHMIVQEVHRGGERPAGRSGGPVEIEAGSDDRSAIRARTARKLDRNSFHLMERNLITSPIVEPRRFLRRDCMVWGGGKAHKTSPRTTGTDSVHIRFRLTGWAYDRSIKERLK